MSVPRIVLKFSNYLTELIRQRMEKKCLQQFLKGILKYNYKCLKKSGESKFGTITNLKFKVTKKLIGFKFTSMEKKPGKGSSRRAPITN